MNFRTFASVSALLVTAHCTTLAQKAPVYGSTGKLTPGAFSVNIIVDENGNGLLTNTNGFSSGLPAYFAADPGPGGLASVLTYDTLNPPGLVSGDVNLTDADFGGFVLDVIRFNADEVNPSGNRGSLLFYSDNIDGFDSKGDTSGPPGGSYTNSISISEDHLFWPGVGWFAGAIYTPTAGQPGFVNGAGGPVNYVLISDVPEPGTYALVASLGLSGVVLLRRRRSR